MKKFGPSFDTCIACASPHISFWKSKSSFYTSGEQGFDCDIYVCRECGTGFLNPPPSQELLESTYATRGHGLTKPVLLEDVLRAEQKFPNTTLDACRMIKYADLINVSGSKIALDVGSGYGFCTKELRARGYHTISINPGKFENEVFKQLNGEYPIVGMIQDVKLDNKFGIIVLSQVLEHIPSPADIIHHLSSFLENGGVLVCAVPNFNSFSVKLRGVKDEGCLWIPEHVNYLTIEGLLRLFGASNLQIIESS